MLWRRQGAHKRLRIGSYLIRGWGMFLRHLSEEGRIHAREAGQEAGAHREGRWFAVCHTVLGQDVAQVL
jgi:hypothetical protein